MIHNKYNIGIDSASNFESDGAMCIFKFENGNPEFHKMIYYKNNFWKKLWFKAYLFYMKNFTDCHVLQETNNPNK